MKYISTLGMLALFIGIGIISYKVSTHAIEQKNNLAQVKIGGVYGTSKTINGCMDKVACNYDPKATVFGPGAFCHYAHLSTYGTKHGGKGYLMEVTDLLQNPPKIQYVLSSKFFPPANRSLASKINFKPSAYPEPNDGEPGETHNYATEDKMDLLLVSFDIYHPQTVKNYNYDVYGMFSKEFASFDGVPACELEKKFADFKKKQQQ